MNKSEIMRTAWSLRDSGMSPSQALRKAWSEEGNPMPRLPTWLILTGAGIGIFRLVAKRWPWEKSLSAMKPEAIEEAQRIVTGQE